MHLTDDQVHDLDSLTHMLKQDAQVQIEAWKIQALIDEIKETRKDIDEYRDCGGVCPVCLREEDDDDT